MKKILMLFALLLMTSAGHVWAQRIISGQVLDETGLGMPGVGVTIEGTQSGTVSDADGNFSLEVPSDKNTLIFQSVGYETQNVAITGNVLNVKMGLAARQLEGAVVTALAIKREKREIGYAATTLNTEEINNAHSVSALSAIQGKSAGVNITSTTGAPGGSTRVVMRGENSITGNNQALIVVDGIILNNTNRLSDFTDARSQIDFGNRGNDIPPEDIESVTVLKGPSAAALYGAIGANGAVMITTKKGKRTTEVKPKTEASFMTSWTWLSVLKLPDFQNTYGQGNVNDVADDRRENFSWGLPFDGRVRPWGQVIDGRQKVKPYSAVEDNVRDFFDVGHTWQNTFSLGGGGENSSFYLSINTLNNEGVMRNTFYDKYSIRFNGSADLSNHWYTAVNLNYMNISSRVETQGQGEGSIFDNVLQTPRDIPIQELENYEGDIFSSMEAVDTSGVDRYGYYGAYTLNPFWVADKFDNRAFTDRILGAMVIGYRPAEGWDIYDRISGDIAADRFTYKQPKFDVAPFDPFYDDLTHTLQGGYRESAFNTNFFYNDLIVQYKRQLNEDLGLTALLGQNITFRKDMSSDAEIDPQTNGLVVPNFYNLSNSQGPIKAENELIEQRALGLYGSVMLNYKRALFLELTGRNDWSSTLAEANNSFFYPSLNVSWIFTETFKDKPFFQKDILTYGKLRSSLSSVGNGAPPYANNDPGYIRSLIETNFGAIQFPIQYPSGTVPGYTLQNVLGDQNLKPERTRQFDIGFDLSFLRDRISVEFSYYDKLSTDQIIFTPLPPSTGYTSKVINLGDITNKGFELGIRGTPVKTARGLRWDVFGTFYRNKSNVAKLAEGVEQVVLGGISGMSVTATVGKPFGAFFATDLLTDPQGRVVVDSATGLPLLTTNTVYKGSYQPKFIASLGTSVTYKGWSFNILFLTKQGGVFFSRTKDILDFVGTAKETEDRADKVFPNSVYQTESGTFVPNTSITYSPYEYFTSVIPAGQHVIDASFVKLQEASLYYELPGDMIERTPFGSVKVGIYGTNLAVWTADENMYVDPEVNSGGATNLQGFDFTARPATRSYGISLAVRF